MDASDLVDVLSGSFFALLGIWAAVGQRHWFLRVTVVAVILLGCLLVPAYGVVIEFGLAIAFITAGVWIGHGRKSWQKRFSMQTIMLVMVVVAVISAVFGSAPELDSREWLFFVSVGTYVASIALNCLWIVYGKNLGWRLRVPVGLLVFVAVLCGAYALRGISRGILRSDLQGTLAQYCTWDYFQRWLGNNLLIAGLAVSIIIAVLLLARGSRWFDTQASESQTSPGGWAIVCRTGMTALMLAIFLPLCYIGYRLMTPTPFPEVVMPEPNAYDDLMAAGQSVTDDIQTTIRMVNSMSTEQLGDELTKFEPARSKIQEAFGKEIKVPRLSQSEMYDPNSRSEAIRSLWLLSVEAKYAMRTDNIEQFMELTQQLSRFWIATEEGYGSEHFFRSWGFSSFADSQLHLLSAEQCKRFVRRLWDVEQSRMTLDQRVQLLNIHDENAGWQSHLRVIQRQWSGKEAHFAFRQNYLSLKTNSRLFFAQLAIQAYWLEHSKLPSSLTELVPNYFPVELRDPLGKELLQYQVEGSEYLVYSVGPDGEPGQHQTTDRKLKTPRVQAGDDLVVFGIARSELTPKPTP